MGGECANSFGNEWRAKWEAKHSGPETYVELKRIPGAETGQTRKERIKNVG